MKKNFFFNLIGMALPIVSPLVTVPIYIHHMGVDRYGVLSVVWILLGYLGFLDFSLSRAAALGTVLGRWEKLRRYRIGGVGGVTA